MDLLNDGYVRRLIQDVESSQNKDRREAEIKSFEVYSGNLKEHVETRIKDLYPKTYGSFSIADLNMSKKIVDKMSKAYKQAPQRELSRDTENEAYGNLMRHASSSAAWQCFDVYYNLHRYAAMWFSYVKDEMGEDKIILRPLAPFQFSRVVDSVGNTEVFIVNFPSSDYYSTTDTDGRKSIIQDSHQDTSCKRYAMWNKDQHVVVRVYETDGEDSTCRITYESIEGNENNENPLGVIPAVFCQQGDNAALPIVNPLTSQVIEFNQQYSVMLTGSSLQTFGHLVLSHPEDQVMPNEIYNSLFTYSRLPQKEGDSPTTLSYLNPSPNMDGQLQIMQNYGHQIITEHLGDGSQNVSGSDNFTSGLDRMIAQSDITNIIESNQQVYAKAENDLYLIIRAYYEAMNDMRFRTDTLTVKYPKAKPIESEAEILANIEKKLQLGLIEKFEALMMLDPNMSSDNAKDKISRVSEENRAAMGDFFGDDNGDQRTEDN